MLGDALAAYVSLNLAVAAGALGLLAVEASARRASARVLLSLNYRVAAAVLASALACVLLPADMLLEPFAHAWSTQAFMAFTDGQVNTTPAAIAATIANLDAGSAGRVWIAAVLALLALGIVRTLRDLRALHRLRRESQCVRRHGRVRLWVSDRVDVPFSFWLPHRAHVVVPAWLVERPDAFRMVVAHELQHHRQRDTLWLHVFRALSWVCFLNPFIHLWNRRLARVQEFSCDETIVGTRRWAAAEYARCLFEVATRQSRDSLRPRWATPFIRFGDPHVLTRRIEKMLKRKQVAMPKLLQKGVAAALVAVVAASAYAASSLIQVEATQPVHLNRGAVWPVDNGQLLTGFGSLHHGIDIAATAGTEVRAFTTGIVVAQGSRKGCGEFVEILHPEDVRSRYCNLAQVRVQVKDAVKAGAPIGVIAAPADGKRAHLHFELKMGDKKVDPLDHLPRTTA